MYISKIRLSAVFIFLLFSGFNAYSQLLTQEQLWERRLEEQKKQEQMLKEKLKDFPKNCVIEEYHPSCPKGVGYFFSNGKFFYDHAVDDKSIKYTIGKWFVKNDSLIMVDSVEIGERGIGPEHLVEGTQYADCPSYYFDEYVTYEKMVSGVHRETTEYYFDPSSDSIIDTTKTAENDCPDYSEYFLPGKYKIASTRILKKADLESLSKPELRIMRNEIFARYGYKFKSEDLRKYFLSTGWYKPFLTNVNDYLTDVEKQNIVFIRKFESK